jgi:hypothetical protein
MKQMRFANGDESAWIKGDLAYELDDTLEMGVVKAATAGIRPGSNGYAAFITAFARRVRSKQVSPKRASMKAHEVTQSDSAVILTPDFPRAAS